MSRAIDLHIPLISVECGRWAFVTASWSYHWPSCRATLPIFPFAMAHLSTRSGV